MINEINSLYEKICEEAACSGEINRYSELKEELETIKEERAKGAWIRLRLEHLENDEKSTTFFYNKSKQVFQKKTLTKIKTDLDTEVSSPQEILKELEQYYATLYKSTPSKQDQNILQPDDLTIKFTDEAKRACEGALTLEECKAALKSFKLNKSQGCDGLPAEFYVEF